MTPLELEQLKKQGLIDPVTGLPVTSTMPNLVTVGSPLQGMESPTLTPLSGVTPGVEQTVTSGLISPAVKPSLGISAPLPATGLSEISPIAQSVGLSSRPIDSLSNPVAPVMTFSSPVESLLDSGDRQDTSDISTDSFTPQPMPEEFAPKDGPTTADTVDRMLRARSSVQPTIAQPGTASLLETQRAATASTVKPSINPITPTEAPLQTQTTEPSLATPPVPVEKPFAEPKPAPVWETPVDKPHIQQEAKSELSIAIEPPQEAKVVTNEQPVIPTPPLVEVSKSTSTNTPEPIPQPEVTKVEGAVSDFVKDAGEHATPTVADEVAPHVEVQSEAAVTQNAVDTLQNVGVDAQHADTHMPIGKISGEGVALPQASLPKINTGAWGPKGGQALIPGIKFKTPDILATSQNRLAKKEAHANGVAGASVIKFGFEKLLSVFRKKDTDNAPAASAA